MPESGGIKGDWAALTAEEIIHVSGGDWGYVARQIAHNLREAYNRGYEQHRLDAGGDPHNPRGYAGSGRK